MIGQENLLHKLKSYTLQTFPHTILLTGKRGCGKHTIVKEIANYYKLPIIDITETLNLETINEIYIQTLPRIYLINADDINEKQQNTILKFLEEPVSTSYIILICKNKNILLNTIVNRCTIYSFDLYSKEQLSYFIKDECNKELILDVCETPGQIIVLNAKTLDDTIKLCRNIIDKLNIECTSLACPMNITQKINFKDEYDKIDIDVFLKVLSMECQKEFINNNRDALSIYKILNSYVNKMVDGRYNKQYMLTNMFLDIWNMKRVK